MVHANANLPDGLPSIADRKIASIQSMVVNVSPKSNWVFVEVKTSGGISGWGEATLDGNANLVEAYLSSLGRAMIGSDSFEIAHLARPVGGAPSGRVYAAAVSGVEQALWDVVGKTLGLPVCWLLGGPIRDRVRVYANVNRGTTDRTAEAFAESARRAVEEGFTAVKVAPFDEVVRHNPLRRDGAAELGVERVRAIRQAVGPNIDVLVDCHWRFNGTTGSQIVRQLEDLQPYWIEAVVPETDFSGWERIRRATSATLAGGEMLIRTSDFRTFINEAGVDVVMPDVKWVGGISGVRAVAAVADAFGVQVAPHNPSGPVSTLASLHAIAGLHNAPILEIGHGETDLRSQLIGENEIVESGDLVLGTKPGLGIEFDTELAQKYPGVPISVAGRPEHTGDPRAVSAWTD